MLLKIRSKKSPDRTKELLLPFDVWKIRDGETDDERLASLIDDVLVDDSDEAEIVETGPYDEDFFLIEDGDSIERLFEKSDFYISCLATEREVLELLVDDGVSPSDAMAIVADERYEVFNLKYGESSSIEDVHAKYGHDLHDGKRILVSDDLDFFVVYEKYNNYY